MIRIPFKDWETAVIVKQAVYDYTHEKGRICLYDIYEYSTDEPTWLNRLQFYTQYCIGNYYLEKDKNDIWSLVFYEEPFLLPKKITEDRPSFKEQFEKTKEHMQYEEHVVKPEKGGEGDHSATSLPGYKWSPHYKRSEIRPWRRVYSNKS